MKRRSVVLVVGLMFLVLAMGASAAQVEEQTFSLTADGSVSVDNSAGKTFIHAWDKEEARMITRRKGSGAEKRLSNSAPYQNCFLLPYFLAFFKNALIAPPTIQQAIAVKIQ